MVRVWDRENKCIDEIQTHYKRPNYDFDMIVVVDTNETIHYIKPEYKLTVSP